MLKLVCHGVCRNDPSTFTQAGSDIKFVIVVLGIQFESDERQGTASTFAENLEATSSLKAFSKVVGGGSQVHHDLSETVLAKADQHIVLTDNVCGALAKVKSKGCLVVTKVVDVEDKVLGEIFGATPDGPANTRIGKTILVARCVD